MLFSTAIFLFFYFPFVTLLYFLVPQAMKNTYLFIASFAFFFWGAPAFSLVILASALLDWLLAARLPAADDARRRMILFASLVNNLGILFYYKYTNFLLDNVNAVFSMLGLDPFTFSHIALPIGVSFLAFEKITYTVDIYRGGAAPAERLTDYLMYVFLFPKVLAGPIMKYHDMAAKIERRVVTIDGIYQGLIRFSMGLFKKVFIADSLGEYVEEAFALAPGIIATEDAYLALFTFTMQIYMDFSAYSDMAIGMGRIFGFDFMENFNFPYIAKNFTEYWERWHISLSTWIRDYVYIPLGGSRTGHTYRNLLLAFLISGLWHGANWTFVVWGLYDSLFVMIDRLGWKKFQTRLPSLLNVALTFFFMMLRLSIFRSPSLSYAWDYLGSMFSSVPVTAEAGNFLLMGLHTKAALVLSVIGAFWPLVLPREHLRWLTATAGRKRSVIKLVLPRENLIGLNGRGDLFFAVAAVLLLILSCAKSVTSTFHPFLYFRF